MNDLATLIEELQCRNEWEAAEALTRLADALTRCHAVGCSQVKEIAQRAISSLPISDCSCKIEMGSFRFRGSHCILCGGVIG